MRFSILALLAIGCGASPPPTAATQEVRPRPPARNEEHVPAPLASAPDVSPKAEPPLDAHEFGCVGLVNGTKTAAPGASCPDAKARPTPEEIQGTIRESFPKILACPQRVSEETPFFVHFEIAVDGATANIRVSSPKTSLPGPFAACVKEVFSDVHFSKPTIGRSMTITYPITLAP